VRKRNVLYNNIAPKRQFSEFDKIMLDGFNNIFDKLDNIDGNYFKIKKTLHDIKP
jgi:hypothetical protein